MLREQQKSLLTVAAEFEIRLYNVLMYGQHGVLPEERTLGNQYRVNICLRIDASDFDVDADELSSTISYAEVFEILQNEMNSTAALLETVAVKFARRAQNKWSNLKSGEIEIVKTVPPIPGMIGEACIRYKF